MNNSAMTKGKAIVLESVLFCEVGIYLAIMVYLIFTAYKLLIKHRYYKEYNLLMFYILALFVLITRLVYFAFFSAFFTKYKEDYMNSEVSDIADSIAGIDTVNMAFKIAIGLT